MDKYWRIVFIIAFGILALAFMISLFGVRNRLDSKRSVESFAKLEEPVEVELVPKHNFLNIIVVTLKNSNLQSTDQFRFSLAEGDTILRQVDFSGRNVGDPSDVRLQFSPVEDSKNKKLVFRIQNLTNSSKDAIYIGIDKLGRPAYSSYFRTLNKREVVASVVHEWGENLSDNSLFFISWIVLLALIIFWAKKK